MRMTSKASLRNAGGRTRNDALSRAVSLHKAGDLAGAERLYRTINRRDPDYGEALRMRALMAHQKADSASAVKLARRAVQQQNSDAVFHHTLAEALRADGQLDAAIVSYRRAWKLMPERKETGADLAQAQADAGHVDEAIATWQTLLPDAPDPGLVHTRIAKLYNQHCYVQAALETIERWRGAAADDARTWYELGRAYVTIRRPAEAIGCYRAAVERAPNYAEACAGLGSALQLHGQHEEGCRWLEKALDLKPDLGWVYSALVSTRSYEWTAERRAVLERLADDSSVPERERMRMQFALGALHDRDGAYEQAFRSFEKGNRMHTRRKRFDPGDFERGVDRVLRLFDRAFFEQRADYGVKSEKPLFIVGMPRSGTSLVEQIVASHPQACGAGELEHIGSMVRELRAITGSRVGFPKSVGKLDKAQSVALAQRYLGALESHDDSALRVTDKLPLNLLRLGFIALLFPHARVVYCRRDAMDNCLSCFFQLFHEGLVFTYDQEHLGHVYRLHERVMAHWADTLPLDMLTVDYEKLVADQEAESRRLIEFAGLPWNDRCLLFHETKRDVQTASTWQVRQPMYQSSVERWRSYEPWLQPLRKSLGK